MQTMDFLSSVVYADAGAIRTGDKRFIFEFAQGIPFQGSSNNLTAHLIIFRSLIPTFTCIDL